MRTVVCQSARRAQAPGFLLRCLESVEVWAAESGFEYRFADDEAFFGRLPAAVRAGAEARAVVQSDLARLLWLQDVLDEGADRAIWLDADVLVFGPLAVTTPDGYAFGREHYVQRTDAGKLRVYKNVHNALCVFARDNPMLDFYLHAATRIVTQAGGGGPLQLVGPKLLTALSNLCGGLPVLDAVGSFSPLVLRDLAQGCGPALDLLRAATPGVPGGANLCGSHRGRTLDGVLVDDALFQRAIDALLDGALTAPG